MGRNIAPSLIAGIASAALYIAVFTFGMGFLFLFLPTVPIFWLGLTRRFDEALHASLFATIALAIFTNPVGALAVYLLGLGFPAWYISRESVRVGMRGSQAIWFPLTVIFARLMAAFSFLLLAVSLYYGNENGGLPGLVASHIHQALVSFSAEIDEKTAAVLQDAAPNLAFLIFSISAWMWGACLYLHAWAVNHELKRQRIATRPDMAVAPFPPPNWTISLLLIAAVASLVGSPILAFWGKSSLIILLFPHFLFGLALLHAHTRKLEHRHLVLFSTYVVLAVLLWPVLILAGYGFIYHIRLLNKYLSDGGNSSRS